MISPSTFLRCGSALLSSLLLVQCGSTAVSLDYQPGLTQIVPGPTTVSAGRFANSRGQSANVLGEVRTPLGTPMEQVITNIPVEEIVRNSFAYGLKSRNMLVAQNFASYVISGEVLEFNVIQVVRPAAYARIRVNLIHKPTGHVVFSKIYKSERENGPYLPGTGSPVPALQELGSRVLQDVVDQALDDVALRARINNSGAR
jgi:hypothetical protein